MQISYIRTATFLGALSVALGAFAAHGLKQIVDEHAVSIFETGVRYQFYHVFALLLAGILYKEFNNGYIQWSGRLFIAGITCFSGSLYIITYMSAIHAEGLNWIGPVTPLGGLLLIAGWVSFLLGIRKK